MVRFVRSGVASTSSPKPVFDLNLNIQLNPLMAEQLVDMFDAVMVANNHGAKINFPPELWAMYKQLENWVGVKEEANE